MVRTMFAGFPVHTRAFPGLLGSPYASYGCCLCEYDPAFCAQRCGLSLSNTEET